MAPINSGIFTLCLAFGSLLLIVEGLSRTHRDDTPAEGTKDETGVESAEEKTASTTPQDFIDEALQAHNAYRKLHTVPDLVLNTTLNEFSQAYANALASKNPEIPDHSKTSDKYELGENIYFFRSTKKGKTPNATKTVSAWYDEIKDYDFNDKSDEQGDNPVLHFTQIVWKATTQMGISFAATTEPDDKDFYTTFVVANYYPRANFDSFSENVLPSSDSGSAGKDGAGKDGDGSDGKGSGVSTTAGLGISLVCLILHVIVH